MARCGCSGDSCSCVVVAGNGARVSGSGTRNNPIRIDALPMSIVVQDSADVDLTLTGAGTAADPFVISATVDVSTVSSQWTVWTGTSAEFALETPTVGTLYVIDDS